ncbi:hypothetical protein I4U23_029582 [Adineta vaga]|nr:hypothetical protein I4U23_029582 [Adineta vaga]
MSCIEDSHPYWSYEKPSEWCKRFPHANGSWQSPIDIDSIDTIPQMYPPFVFSSKYDSDQLFTLNNDGQQITATLSTTCMNDINKNELWFSGSGLQGRFHFVNFHLHWGRNNRHGSEHEINGHRFPAEAHFVHKNHDNGQIAVLALFLTIIEDTDNINTKHNEWEKYADVASQLNKIQKTATCTFNLSQLMQIDDRDFFRYVGSLTTPPCTEGIIWTIFSHAIPMKGKSLNLLRQNILKKVHRPIQPINGRTIFRNYYHYYYSKTI